MLPILPALALQVAEPKLIYPTRPHIIRPTEQERMAFDPAFAGIGPIAAGRRRGGVTAGSFLLNGTSGTIEKSSSVVTGYPYSLAAWIKPDAGLANTASFAVGGVGAGTARLSLTDPSGTAGTNVISAQSTNAAGTTATGAGPTNWSAGAWCLVVGVWAASNSRVAYFNGTAGTTNTGGSTTDLTTYTKSNFGASYVGGSLGRFFNGKMAYMAMWNVALSGSDVTALYNGGAGALPTTVQGANLLLYPVWSGGSVIDQIGGGSLSSPGVMFDADLPF